MSEIVLRTKKHLQTWSLEMELCPEETILPSWNITFSEAELDQS